MRLAPLFCLIAIPLTGQILSGNVSVYGNARLASAPIDPPATTASNYFLWIGQSNARGIEPAITTLPSPSDNNRMWSGGVLSTGFEFTNQTLTGFLPLVEASKETPVTAFARHLRLLAGTNWNNIQANYARGGAAYSIIEKGGTGSNYALSVASVAVAKGLLTNLFVPALLSVHGESDGPSGYDAKMIDWQSDYQSDIQAITGQSSLVPIFHSQVQQQDSTGTNGMLSLHENYPTKNILVCPKYQFIYQPEGTHFTNKTYTQLGEYYAEAVYKRVVLGQTWNPLRPLSIASNANVISITFTGMVGPLRFDTNTVLFQTNYGFEYIDNTPGAPTISSVVITGEATNVVEVTLSGAPNPNTRIAYAFTGGPFGYATGCRGNIRDSNPSTGSVTGSNLWNWAVHFYKPLNWP